MKIIPLTKGQFAIVDDVDFEFLSQFVWAAMDARNRSEFYATARIYKDNWRDGSRTVLMHRLLLDAQESQEVDHWNGYGLDNQRCNLRLCSRAQNNANTPLSPRNTSGFKGVVWSKHRHKWIARISWRNQTCYIGSFENAQNAALAYDKKAFALYGEFARTNAMLGLL